MQYNQKIEQKNIETSNQSNEQKKLKPIVKECKERTFLKKLVFIEKALTYASLRDLLKEKENLETTRQYLYGIISGRLIPSFEFATKLCRTLGIQNIYTVFNQNEIHLPNFKTAYEISQEEKNKE